MEPRDCVSALIVTYESHEHIQACLQSLYEHSASWLRECIVVDNHSADNTVEILKREFPQIRVIVNDRNVGFGKAVNQAAKYASGEYLWVLNPDTKVNASTVAELVLLLDYRDKAGACGPKIVNLSGEFQRVSRRGFPSLSAAFGYLSGLDRLFPHGKLGAYHRRRLSEHREVTTDCLSGCCMLIRRSVFEEVGGFDEDYFLFGEDIDLCWKIARAGYERWYVPRAWVVHVKGASMDFLGSRARREFYHSMELYIDKRLTDRYSPPIRIALKLGVRAVQFAGRWM